MIRKVFLFLTLMIMSIGYMAAQAQADIKFDKMSHNFGDFPETDPVVKCTFTFTNVGDGPLVVHQVVASCGCTVPEYTQEPIMPGKTGTIQVTYSGRGKYPGHFSKSITVRSNAKSAERIKLTIEGNMTEAKTKK